MTSADPSAAGIKADRLSLLVEAVQEYAIFMLDPDGLVLTWNSGAERIKGYRAEEIIGQHFSVFYLAEDVEAGKPGAELARAEAEGEFRDEGYRVRKDGSTFWANVSLTAVRDASGHLEGFAKITRDESDRRRNEEQSRQIALLTEREALAAELREQIVHRIFRAGLHLESSLQFVDDPTARQRIQAAVGTLDEAVKEIRTAALGLESHG